MSAGKTSLVLIGMPSIHKTDTVFTTRNLRNAVHFAIALSGNASPGGVSIRRRADLQSRRNKMDIGKVIQKGLLGALTFGVSFLTPTLVLKMVPDSIENMTVGAIIAALVVAGTNVVKNWNKK